MLDRFRATSLTTQFVLLLLAASTLLLLLWAGWFYMFRMNWQVIYDNLKPADAATVIAELDKRKIPYRLSDGGLTVAVPADKADVTRVELGGADLRLKGTVGFELFNKSDMGITDFAQKINYQRALQGELARTIMGLDGVDSARVHLSLGEERLFRADRVDPKASVTVRMDNDQPVNGEVSQGIQRLVAAAVPQLDPAAVVVIDESGRIASAAAQSEALSDSPDQQEKRAVETYYGARVREALAENGQGDSVRVAVSAGQPMPLPGYDGNDVTDEGKHRTLAPRNFSLRLMLSSSHSFDAETEQNLRSIARTAIQFSDELGDTILLGPQAASPPVRAVPWSRARGNSPTAAYSAETAGNRGISDLAMMAGSFLALIVLAAIWLARSGRNRAHQLAAGEHEAFAARLSHAVRDGE